MAELFQKLILDDDVKAEISTSLPLAAAFLACHEGYMPSCEPLKDARYIIFCKEKEQASLKRAKLALALAMDLVNE